LRASDGFRQVEDPRPVENSTRENGAHHPTSYTKK